MLKLLPSLSLEQYKNHKVSWLNWLFRKRAIDLILLTPPGPSGSTWDHMGPHMGPQLQRNLESLALQLAILGSIPQKIRDLLGKFKRSNPNSSWIFRGFIILEFSCWTSRFFFKLECFLKGVGDFHGVMECIEIHVRNISEAPIFPKPENPVVISILIRELQGLQEELTWSSRPTLPVRPLKWGQGKQAKNFLQMKVVKVWQLWAVEVFVYVFRLLFSSHHPGYSVCRGVFSVFWFGISHVVLGLPIPQAVFFCW